MKKLRITVFAVICAVCIAFGAGLMMNVNIAKADTVGTTPTLSETKVMVSTDKTKMLLATAIKDYGDVYEVGYTFDGEITPVKNENNKFYRTISDGVNTITPADIFDVAWKNDDGVGMIIWEIEFSAGTTYEYKAYALVGNRNGENQLIAAEPEVRVTPNDYTAKQFYTVTIAANNGEYGSVSKSSIAVPSGSTVTVEGNVVTVGGIAVTATKNTDDAQYTYGFTGFTGTTETVTENMTITANFTRTVNEYTVSIASNNGDYGTVSAASVSNVPYGTAITVEGNVITVGETAITATKTADTAQYTYAFTGFTGTAATVTGDMNVVANFTRTVNQYVITIDMDGGTLSDGVDDDITSLTVAYGTAASELDSYTKTKLGYTFNKWQYFNGENYVDLPAQATVESAISIKAIWTARNDTAYTVRVYTESGKINNYVYADTPLTGTTDTVVNVNTADYCPVGYTYNSEKANVTSGTIAADGSLMLVLYYDCYAAKTSFDFESADDMAYMTMGVNNATLERVSYSDEATAYANEEITAPANFAFSALSGGGDYALKVSNISSKNFAVKFSFKEMLPANSTISFKIAINVGDSNYSSSSGWIPTFYRYGYDSTFVNDWRENTSSAVYWHQSHTATGGFYWSTVSYTMTEETDYLNFGLIGGNGNARIVTPSTVVMYVDDIFVMTPHTAFNFSTEDDLKYITTKNGLGTLSIVDYATENSDGKIDEVGNITGYEPSGNILKLTETGVSDSARGFCVNFGQTLTAGTVIKFSVFIYNPNATDNMWCKIGSGSGSFADNWYWSNHGGGYTVWRQYWVEYTLTLSSDTSVVEFWFNYGAGMYSGSVTDRNALIYYVDNIRVVAD